MLYKDGGVRGVPIIHAEEQVSAKYCREVHPAVSTNKTVPSRWSILDTWISRTGGEGCRQRCADAWVPYVMKEQSNKCKAAAGWWQWLQTSAREN